ncbi:MAG: hypothetical protein ACFB02_16635 [Mastigocoleus sp.]
MIEQLESEIALIRSEISRLRQERAVFTVDFNLTEEDSPSAIIEAYRFHARDNAVASAEIKGIDDAIYALNVKLKQKQEHLQRLKSRNSIQEQLEEARNQAKIHAEKINNLAYELATEISLLKSCADELSPMYWQIYYKPFITGFKTITVPHIRSDGDVWTIVNRVV